MPFRPPTHRRSPKFPAASLQVSYSNKRTFPSIQKGQRSFKEELRWVAKGYTFKRSMLREESPYPLLLRGPWILGLTHGLAWWVHGMEKKTHVDGDQETQRNAEPRLNLFWGKNGDRWIMGKSTSVVTMYKYIEKMWNKLPRTNFQEKYMCLSNTDRNADLVIEIYITPAPAGSSWSCFFKKCDSNHPW